MNSAKANSRGSFHIGNTKMVTRAGTFLRKSKLDELPQLWNVFKGDMSFVGPRPEVRQWVNVYPDRWAIVHTVKPGITDPASIYYRNEEKLLSQIDDPIAFYRDHVLLHKINLYENYIETRSFFGDIYIIFKTIFSLIFPEHFSIR
jgi:lipopolysaccharide/colanic/teichoic acid biosynthesis glycosyltransferase